MTAHRTRRQTCRDVSRAIRRHGVAVALLAGVATTGHAQSVAVDTGHTAGLSRGAQVAATAGLIVLGASGAQIIKTPKAWPRTVGGFGQRVADQTGFYLVQTGTQRLLTDGLGWRVDETPCVRRAILPLAGCAVVRTFTARDAQGNRHAAVPFLASVGVATGASVFWRPERASAPQARGFVATRLGIVFAGYAAERMLLEWRRAREGAR